MCLHASDIGEASVKVANLADSKRLSSIHDDNCHALP